MVVVEVLLTAVLVAGIESSYYFYFLCLVNVNESGETQISLFAFDEKSVVTIFIGRGTAMFGL